MLVSMFARRQAGPSVKTQNHDDPVALKDLVEAGKVRPVIDRMYTLGETAEAIDRIAGGDVRGTIVIKVAPASSERLAPEIARNDAPTALPALA